MYKMSNNKASLKNSAIDNQDGKGFSYLIITLFTMQLAS